MTRKGDRGLLLCILAATAATARSFSTCDPATATFASAQKYAARGASVAVDRRARRTQPTRVFSEVAASTSGGAPVANEEEEEEEWEYVEIENLTEEDLFNSEWKVGTVMSDRPTVIKETWARLITKDGENLVVWGDGSKGKWSLDVASQFLSMSKESIGGWFGKKIWAGVVDDYYYLQGTVRGWSPISPASVLGQWQAKRLGVDPEEAGVAPWFETQEEDGETAASEVREGGGSPGSDA